MTIARQSSLAIGAALVLNLLWFSSVFANSPTFSQDPFTDIPKTHPRYTAIEYLRTNNVLKGYLDGMYHPNRRITRAETLMLMTNPFLLNATRGAPCITNSTDENAPEVELFDDVDRDDWFADAVCTAREYNLVNGYPDGTFKPNNPITFVEAAKMASKVLELHARRDQAADPLWYTVYVRHLEERNAIPTNIRALDQIMTRADMAEILYRLKSNNESLPSKNFADLSGGAR